jgi:hypothetical protein
MECKLTEREQIVFDRLAEGPATTDDLLEAFSERERRSLDRGRITVVIKYLAAKIAVKGYCIQRVSPLGRGSVGRYEMNRGEGEDRNG